MERACQEYWQKTEGIIVSAYSEKCAIQRRRISDASEYTSYASLNSVSSADRFFKLFQTKLLLGAPREKARGLISFSVYMPRYVGTRYPRFLCLIKPYSDGEKGLHKPGLNMVWKIVSFQLVVVWVGFPQFNII